MNATQTNIGLVSNDKGRIEKYRTILSDPTNKLFINSLKSAFKNALIEYPLEVVIVDAFSEPDFDFRSIESFRNQKKLANIPFIFLLSSGQQALKRQIFKNTHNLILIEPVDKFEFLSLITSTIYLSQIERRVLLYKDIVDGEKRLISSMDEILEINRIIQIKDESKVFHYLEHDFAKRMELALAVESTMFATYDSNEMNLTINLYDDSGSTLQKKLALSLKKSQIFKNLSENHPRIFEYDECNDPFIQDLEESIGFKISSLMFIPFSIFHEPRGGFILLNKLYRREFSENDLAFALVAARKIVFHLEELYINEDDLHSIRGMKLIPGRTEKVIADWKLYQTMLGAVQFGIIVFDKSYKVYYLNKSARRLLQITEDEDASTLKKLFEPSVFKQIMNSIQEDSVPVIRQEIQISMNNLPDLFIGYSVYDLDVYNNKHRYILVFSEISQTKKIQAEIIRMDRMASLGILSSGFAHEVRNPLAGIKSMAQVLEEEMDDEPTKQEYVKRIIRQVNRLDDLLKSFFTYAKPVKPDPKSCHIKKIVQEVLPLFERKMREQNITVRQHYARDLDNIFVDSNQIEQVIFNLIINALDAMPQGGELTIKAENERQQLPMIDRRQRIPGLFSDKYIQITISDTGIGLDSDLKEKIFDPFYTTKSNGTGLGLSIVYQIIREHSGQISADGKQGEGSQFIILLPAVEPEQKDEIIQ